MTLNTLLRVLGSTAAAMMFGDSVERNVIRGLRSDEESRKQVYLPFTCITSSTIQ
jgi:hypothetical protein